MKYLILQNESAVIFADNVTFAQARAGVSLPAVSFGDFFTRGKFLVLAPKNPDRLAQDGEAIKAINVFAGYAVRNMSAGDTVTLPHVDKRIYTQL